MKEKRHLLVLLISTPIIIFIWNKIYSILGFNGFFALIVTLSFIVEIWVIRPAKKKAKNSEKGADEKISEKKVPREKGGKGARHLKGDTH